MNSAVAVGETKGKDGAASPLANSEGDCASVGESKGKDGAASPLANGEGGGASVGETAAAVVWARFGSPAIVQSSQQRTANY